MIACMPANMFVHVFACVCAFARVCSFVQAGVHAEVHV